VPIDQNQYLKFLDDVKARIHNSRIRMATSVNKELIQLYWWIGKQIVEKQEELGWGKSIVEQLSKDLRKSLSGRSGFSVQNLWYMRQFYLEYKNDTNLQQLVGEIPWGQNLVILSKVKDQEARRYYLESTISMRWSRNVLLHQIKSKAYERHSLSNKQHNFQRALPEHLAEQADQAMKDVYMLDMLGVAEPVLEAQLEARMVGKIKEVLLELGYGFAFIGNQYRIVAGNKEYFIDLLFYNRRLRSLVAIELKVGRFKPEYAGKMNFYLNILDDFVREEGENPSIGIILCSDRDYFEVEYTLRGIDKPVGISEYRLTRELPPELKNKLPEAKQLEDEIRKEMTK
jgi:predicted nuclease of restriction endonuclease-like (RecB) superfamily